MSALLDLVNQGINSVFGETVIYDSTSLTYSLTGTFSDESLAIAGDGEVISSAPSLMIRTADLPSGLKPTAGHRVFVGSDWYEIFEVRRDDSAAWMLALKRIYS